MLKTIKAFWDRRAGTGVGSVPAPADDEDIPRYPPFARGLPAVPADRLLGQHTELIEKIRLAIGLPEPEYRRIVAPVIARYAAFVHLLPASQAHHHRGAGGLLAHGLEVAWFALRGTEDVLFTAREDPGRRRELELRWRVAAAIAGLTHDLGKPVSGLSVTDRDGGRTWKPYRHDIVAWARQDGVDRYFLHWRAGRHRTHEVMASLVMERALTDACKDWLGFYSDEILEAMLCAIVAPDRSPMLGPLVLAADNASVEIDLRRHGQPAEESWGVPVERYVMDAMRRLVAKSWTVNRPGARVWLFREGLHIVWRQAAAEIVELLAGDRVPGVPRDADTIADILISRDLAIPRETPEGAYRYWPMSPTMLTKDAEPVRLLMLRLSSPQLLFDEPPAPVAAQILDARPRQPKDGDAATAEEGAAPTDGRRRRSTPARAPARPDRPSTGPENPATAADPQPESGAAATAGTGSPGGDPPSPPAPGTAAGQGRVGGGPPGPERPEAPEPADGIEPRPPPTEPAARPQGSTGTPRRPERDGDDRREDALIALAATAAWERSAFWRDPYVVLHYPDAFSPAGDPAVLLSALDAAGALERDPLRPKARVRRHGDVEGAVLTETASAAFRAAAHGEAAGAPPAQHPAGATDPRAGKARRGRDDPDGRCGEDGDPVSRNVDAVAAEMVRQVLARAPGIPGGVAESGDGECSIRQTAIAWFAARHGVSASDLRAAAGRRSDVELVGSVRVKVKNHVGSV